MAVRKTYANPWSFDWSETAKQAEQNISEGLKTREGLILRKPYGF